VAGSSELIKLYLYTLTQHPIVVHWDIDVIVLVSVYIPHGFSRVRDRRLGCDF
jgi:hypothetical protein